MKVISDNISTSTIKNHRQIIFNRIINVIAILGFIEKSKNFFQNGYWIEAKNVTKNGPETFIKQLNKCTSYHQNERNHTFTHVLYIPYLGYSLINFLNEKMASQFIYEKQGVNWLDQTDSDSDEESEENENEKTEETDDENETNYDKKIVEMKKFEQCEMIKKKKMKKVKKV